MPTQPNLFADEVVKLKENGAEIEYYASFIAADVAWDNYHKLLKTTDWQQESLLVYGKVHLAPRLSSWVGDQRYSYSNMTMQPSPWTPLLLELKQQIELFTGHSFNSVLLNFYRDGQDSNGWHSDDEPELGRNPVIASLSLGAPRDFDLRYKPDHSVKHRLTLENGSLLLMKGATQHCWQHHIPKRAKADGRINLTFRTII